ncbi:glycosyltransferase family 2 protein [Oxalobacteraceae bacterium OTU3CINTB1]|nr:glycosyltransferase family 2 protein [Oxalobacteraceae bacterium OTU3CINTB1]
MSGLVDVLLPTCNRPQALTATLVSLAAQSTPHLQVVISDQSDGGGSLEQPSVLAALRFLLAQGHEVSASRHLPRRGMAEQRAFLLSRARAPYSLFLDDDVLLDSDLIERLLSTITEQRCGFVGSALHGLSHVGDVRPDEEAIEFWQSPVAPESIAPDGPAWRRHHLHSAANLFHVQSRLGITRANSQCYRVAWIGGCVLYDTAKLRAAGGFDFWRQLPAEHCGEDAQAQLQVMARFGGCGIIPSGAYHMELPTTITERACNAPHVLRHAEMLRGDVPPPRQG